jgi:nucleotide-binding universal stress UspA family protein
MSIIFMKNLIESFDCGTSLQIIANLLIPYPAARVLPRPGHFEVHQGPCPASAQTECSIPRGAPDRSHRHFFPPKGASMFKRILLPTDGSEQSERAILAGIDFAKELGAEVLGLTVILEFHTFTIDPEMLEDTREEYMVKSEERARKRLQFILDAARMAGVPCTAEYTIHDEVHQAIIDIARDRQCDLIVMASHGRRGIKGVLIGSETQKVLVHSSIPVLVYR